MKTLRSSAAVTLAIVWGLGCSDDPEPSVAIVPDRFREFADTLERERLALEIPGLAVAIVEQGELAFAQGFGTKGVNSDEPVDENTLFRVGSMNKLLTAIGVMSAVDDGLLALDAPLRAAIPDLSLTGPEADALTLRTLLSQQSGLSDYLEITADSADEALAEFASGPELADDVPFINPPGLFWNYSNPNYYLAGRALETATGQPYRQALEERVFAPLGMDRSYLLPSEALADGNFSHGFGVVDVLAASSEHEDLAPDAYDNGWARPAGYAFSNVLDWVHVLDFLIDDTSGVLSETSRTEVVRSQIGTQVIHADLQVAGLGLGDDYGLGVGVSDGFFMDRHAEPEAYFATPALSHGGDIPGFASTFLVLPETGFGIVVLSARDAERPTQSMRLALESFGDLPAPSTPPAGRAVDPTRFASYAGRYVDRQGSAIEVGFDGSTLRASVPALDAVGLPYEAELIPESLDNFALWVTLAGERIPLDVTFIADAQGEFTWFRSRLAVARKEPAPSVAP